MIAHTRKQLVIMAVLLLAGCNSQTGSDVVPAQSRSKWTKVERPLAIDVRVGYATAEGFWQSTSPTDGKQLVSPIGVRISCHRTEGTCRELDVVVQFVVLKPNSVEYQITSWSDGGGVADDA